MTGGWWDLKNISDRPFKSSGEIRDRQISKTFFKKVQVAGDVSLVVAFSSC